jgi:phospholipase/lecithinase/hemolysin
MKNFRSWGAVTLASLLLAACGGGGDGDQSPRVQYSATVSFGDSLSDVGNVRHGGAGRDHPRRQVHREQQRREELDRAAGGAGRHRRTVRGADRTGIVGTAGRLRAGRRGPCRLLRLRPGRSAGDQPVGPGNKALIAAGDTSGYVGQLTVPVVTQISNHLTAVGGSFSGTELVTVMAGGNDVFINLAAVSAAQATPTQAVTAMAQAGGELAAYIKTLILAKGATHVVVVNLPDVSQTPLGYSQSADVQTLINTMVTQFNAQLHAGLAGTTGVLEVDAYTQGRDQVAHPEMYGLTNVTTPACDWPARTPPTRSRCPSPARWSARPTR